MDNDENTGNAPTKTTAILATLATLLTAALIALIVMQMRASRDLNQSVQSLRNEMSTVQMTLQGVGRAAQRTEALGANVQELEEKLRGVAETQEALRNGLQSLRTIAERAENRRAAHEPRATPTAFDACTDEPAPEPDPRQVREKTPQPEPGPSRAELLARLDDMGEHLAALKQEVGSSERKVVRETRVIQEEIGGVKDRIHQAEGNLSSLRETLRDAKLPDLNNQVAAVDRQIAEVNDDVKTLSRKTREFREDMEGFFKQVFYNDPWSRIEQEQR